jgi:hypothetical protein
METGFNVVGPRFDAHGFTSNFVELSSTTRKKLRDAIDLQRTRNAARRWATSAECGMR